MMQKTDTINTAEFAPPLNIAWLNKTRQEVLADMEADIAKVTADGGRTDIEIMMKPPILRIIKKIAGDTDMTFAELVACSVNGDLPPWMMQIMDAFNWQVLGAGKFELIRAADRLTRLHADNARKGR